MNEPISLAEFVLRAVAAACRLDRASIDRATSLLALDADSLTLVSIVAQIEAGYGIALSADDTAELLTARNIEDLIATVQGAISRERAIVDESAGNAACVRRLL